MITVEIRGIGGEVRVLTVYATYQASRLTCWNSCWRLIPEIVFESGGQLDFEEGGNEVD